MIANIMIIFVLVILALIILRVEHVGKKIKIIAIILILFFVFISVTAMLASQEVDLKSPKGILNAAYFYIGWVGRSVSNLWNAGGEVKDIVGNAVKTNSTNSR